MESFKAWIQDSFTPVVLVAATPAAEAICANKNGLGIVDILRPFSHVHGLDASIRVGDELLKFQEFKFRLHAVSNLMQPRLEALEQHLHVVLHAAALKYPEVEGRTEQLLAAAAAGKGPPVSLADLAPWFAEYSAEFMRLTAWSEHQMTNHPVAAILVAPADVPTPVQYFEALLAQLALPPLMQQEVMYPLRDREFPRHYLLLQDGSAALQDERKAQENLQALRRTFGDASVSLLKINTGTGDRAVQAATPELFHKFQAACLQGGGAGEPEARPAAPPQSVGAWLSVTDLDALAAFMRSFVSQLLLPRLEERVAKLNAAVTATRRGLRNRITRLWKGSSDEAASDKPFLWHSVESQLKQLADLTFMLGAYSFANDMYRLAGQDYQAAGNSRWYAGAEEMRGLSIIMAPNDADPQKYFARAYDAYCRAPATNNPWPRLLATRTVLLSARFQQAAGRYLAASVMLMRPHQQEESARAGVLLEQSAYSLLFTQPPSIRKFAFHMVLAGLRYNAAGLKKLGLHAYKQVLGVYANHQWRAIEEHLNDVLGRLCAEFGDAASACNHFLALLHDVPAGRSSALQALYMDQFSQVVRKAAPKDVGGFPSLPALRLPHINAQDVRVLFADTSCCGNPTAATLPDTSWSQLEVACSGDVSVMRDVAVAAMKQQTKEHEEYNTCVAGEAVGITVTLRNKLAVKLKVSELRLVCEFIPLDEQQAPMELPATSQSRVSTTDTGSEDGSEDGTASLHPLGGNTTAAWMQQKNRYLSQQAVSCRLHPGEAVSEVLSVTPLAAGWLRIKGCAWVVNDTVEGHLEWQPRGIRRKHPKGPRLSQQKHFVPSRRLLFNVVPAMCRLQLESESLMPTSMFTGEVQRVVLSIRNVGTAPCRNMQLAISHPEVVCSASWLDNNQPNNQLQPGAAQTGHQGDSTDKVVIQPLRLPASLQGSGVTVFRYLPASTQLDPQHVQHWELWLHPRGAGKLTMQLVWYCEPLPVVAGSSTGIFKFRTLRTAHALQVMPLVLPRPLVTAAPTDLAAHLLRLDLDAQQGRDSVVVSQVCAMTRGRNCGWQLATEQLPTAIQASALQQSSSARLTSHKVQLQPPLHLTPGVPASVSLVLYPPSQHLTYSLPHSSSAHTPLTSQVALPAAACNGEASREAAALEGADDVVEPACGCPSGLLSYWYQAQPRGAGGFTAGDNRMAGTSSMARIASTTSLSSSATWSVGVGSSVPASQHCDPPVDLAVVWRQVSNSVADGPASTAGAAGGSDKAAAKQRTGVVLLTDVTGTLRPPTLPLRNRLEVVSHGGGAVITHDFRHSAMCRVHLLLRVRNCMAQPVQLGVEAGEDWQHGVGQPGQSGTAALASHAWHVSPPAAQPQLSASSSFNNLGQQQLSGMGPLERASLSPGPTSPAPPQRQHQAGLQPGADYVWCGRTHACNPELAPGACWDVPLVVGFFKPGMYQVKGVRLSYASADHKQALVMTEALKIRVDVAQ